MSFVRWVLLLPGAVLTGVLGSLAGGVAAMVFGQSAMDTTSAFLGSFMFTFVAGLIAPSWRAKTTSVAATLVAILAIGTFLLSSFSTIQEFATLSVRERVLTPVAQILGALYALFLLPPLVTAGTTLERLWREFIPLSGIVALFGFVLAFAGVLAGLLGRGWFSLAVGIGVMVLGALTWLFPLVHMNLRVIGLQRVLANHRILEQAAQEKREPPGYAAAGGRDDRQSSSSAGRQTSKGGTLGTPFTPPPTVGDFKLEEVTPQPEIAGGGFLARYRATPTSGERRDVRDVFIYRVMRLGEQAAGETSPRSLMNEAIVFGAYLKAQVEQGVLSSIEVRDTKALVTRIGGARAIGHRTHFSWSNAGTPEDTFLHLYVFRGHYIKFRITAPPGQIPAESAAGFVDAFLSQLIVAPAR